MSDQVQKHVDGFVKLPLSERSDKYFSLPVDARRKARKQVESRRGIAYRGEGGVIVFKKQEYERQIEHFNQKIKECDARKKRAQARKQDLEQQLSEHYGDE